MSAGDLAHDVDLERALEAALACADDAVRVLRDVPRGEVRTKQHAADLVTDVDVATERAIRARLADTFPGHLIVGEELGGEPDLDGGTPTWWCDPVDGTTNLASGLPWTSFSLALAVGREPLVGVVADPWRGEVWWATRGGGAWRRPASGAPERLAVAGATGLEGQVLLTEWASFAPWPGMLELLAALSQRHCTSRVMGSGTLSVASVGLGRAAAAVIGAFGPEDHLAGLLISSEAGAVVRDASGRETRWPGPGPFSVAAPGVDADLRALLT